MTLLVAEIMVAMAISTLIVLMLSEVSFSRAQAVSENCPPEGRLVKFRCGCRWRDIR
jgi:hypothetical protein